MCLRASGISVVSRSRSWRRGPDAPVAQDLLELLVLLDGPGDPQDVVEEQIGACWWG